MFKNMPTKHQIKSSFKIFKNNNIKLKSIPMCNIRPTYKHSRANSADNKKKKTRELHSIINN